MTTWFTSDNHFSHKNTLRYCGRPFWNIEECDKAMIDRWNAVVKPEDTVYHIGDVAMHTAPIKRILPQLNGKKILIIGNHDLVYPYFTKTRGQHFTDRMYDEYTMAGFSEIYASGYEVKLCGTKLRLSHFPTKNCYDPHHSDKHDAVRPVDDGTPNICGHVHQNWKQRGNNINVGVDVWDFAPVSLETILNMFLPDNIGNPNKWRVKLWKLYHTIRWRLGL